MGTTLLERLDELELVFRQDTGEDRELFGLDRIGDRPGRADRAHQPPALATMAAVAGASPVAITVRMPRPRNSVIRAADSLRGGSLSATSPASFIPVGGPAATARTRKPWSSRSLAAAAAADDDWTRVATTAKAPFTMRCASPFAPVAVASAIFLAGSNAANLINFGASGTALPAAAARIAPSTGSFPPSELASAASARTCASSNPGSGWTVVTFSAFCVSVPVLSAQRITIDAASSTAERRVGRMPRFASARAPSADARVNVAGSATGMEARIAVRTRGMISSTGMVRDHE